MTKEEMKNRISMALKDPILQQGFEIICKNLAKLEKENAELKAYADETLGISDIHKYSHKLFDAFEKLEFRTTFNKAIQAFYLERGLYVVRSDSMGKYQYTLVEASSEEKKLKWTDLKVGDILRSPSMIEYLVIGIDRNKSNDTHIRVDGVWLTDGQLRYWEKVE